MLWGALIVGILIIAFCMESDSGKAILALGICALGLGLISWLFDFSFLITLAKICVAIIVLIIVFCIVMAIFGD